MYELLMDFPHPSELARLLYSIRVTAVMLVLAFIVVCGTPVVPNRPKYHIYL